MWSAYQCLMILFTIEGPYILICLIAKQDAVTADMTHPAEKNK